MNTIIFIQSRIKQASIAFFAEGTLEHKTRQAFALSEMTGLDSFTTALPWRIEMPNNWIDGFSETLAFAVRDIHAQLVMLAKSYSFDMPIHVMIDAARLLEPSHRFMPVYMQDGI